MKGGIHGIGNFFINFFKAFFIFLNLNILSSKCFGEDSGGLYFFVT